MELAHWSAVALEEEDNWVSSLAYWSAVELVVVERTLASSVLKSEGNKCLHLPLVCQQLRRAIQQGRSQASSW